MGSMTSCLNNTHSRNSNAGGNEGPDGNNTITVDLVGNKTEVWHENHPEIEQIFISHGDKIYSLQFQYVENRNSKKLSKRHGGSSGDKFDVVKLKRPDEYLTSIRGWRDKRFIKSIAFHTNLGKYGPFGEQSKYDKPFHMVVGGDGQFGGFHGSAMNGITSIGVYINAIPPLPANNATTTIGATTSSIPPLPANNATTSSGATTSSSATSQLGCN